MILLPLIFYTLSDEQRSLIEQIYRRDATIMLQVAKKFLNDQSLAEDMVQQAFQKIIEQIEKNFCDLCNKSTGYFVIIVKNLCIDYKRRADRELSCDEMSYESEQLQGEPIAETPERIAISNESYERLLAIIDELDEAYKLPLKLKLIHKLTTAQIAELLERPEATVNSQIYRGRRILIEKIGKEMEL